MKVLLIHGTLSSPGGIETLLVRLTRYLTENGHQVSLILTYPDDKSVDPKTTLAGEVGKYADIQYAYGDFRTIGPALRKLLLTGFDVIYCLHNSAFLVGLLIQTLYVPDARVLAGVYFPREYCWRSKGKRYQQRLIETIFQQIPDSNVFFMTPSSAADHGECLGRDFSASPIFPLPVDTARFGNTQRKANRRKIVSIGRITVFKTYNFHMVDIVKDLNDEGWNFEYHIYGNGPDFDKLAAYVEVRGASEFVSLHGTLPYVQMESVLEDAFVFVGLGTALMEAAACRVPAIIAVESNPQFTCYGFLQETTGINVGEFVRNQPMFPIKDKIIALAQLNDQEYEAECEGSARRAQEFSIESVMAQFVIDLAGTQKFNFPITRSMLIRDWVDLWIWRVRKRIGHEDPLVTRWMRKYDPCG